VPGGVFHDLWIWLKKCGIQNNMFHRGLVDFSTTCGFFHRRLMGLSMTCGVCFRRSSAK